MLSVLHAKVATIDAACEARARNRINEFHKDVRYDGSRFRCPAFQDVSTVWLELIKEKEQEFISATKTILNAMVSIDEVEISEITTIVEDMLREERYVERLSAFAEGAARKAACFGLSFDREAYNFTLVNAGYRSGVKNMLRTALRNLHAEIRLFLSTQGIQMDFSSLMTDNVIVIKKNGNRFDGIRASVQSGKIRISGATPLIESGDLIQRKMSNGGEETFEVIDPGFREDFHGIPAGYNMTVKKLGIPEAKTTIEHITNNYFTGHNARLNQGSVDNSTNVVNINPNAAEHITALRTAIERAVLSPQEKQSATEVIDAVDTQFKSGRPSKTVVSALLATLPHAANVATIVTSLLSLF